MSEHDRDAVPLPDNWMLQHVLTAGPLLLVGYRVDRRSGGEGRLVAEYYSPNAAPYLGASPAEALHQPEWLLARIPTEDWHLFEPLAHPDRHRPLHVQMECRMLHDDGTHHWMRFRFDEDAEDPDRICGSAYDVTDLHTARANERMSDATLQSFVDNSDAPVFAVDTDLRFTLVNRAVCTTSDIPAERWLGRTVEEVLAQWSRPDVAIARVLRTGEPVMQDERWEIPGQGVRHYLALKFPLRDGDGRIFGVGGISTDVTDRKRQADELEQARRTAEQALSAALEANRAKDAFVSRMSHELRTPLNSILGFGQLLVVDDLTLPQREAVGQIVRAGSHLLDLINEVLDVTGLGQGRLDVAVDTVAVAEVARAAADMVSPLAAQRGIAIHGLATLSPCFVRADRQRCIQILINLLANAVKYNRDGGLVRLACVPRSGMVSLEVDDTGPGIAPEHLGGIFEPFNRLGAERSGIEGTGIGLALSRALAQQMGGDILVRSVPGEGSTFTLVLPEEAPPDASAIHLPDTPSAGRIVLTEDDGPPEPATTTLEVLCIEDNPANLRLIERVFALRPAVTLWQAMTGQHGIELAKTHRPRLVMVDLHLPDLDGAEVVRRLRAETSVPCVAVVSADANTTRVQQLLAGGADLYFTKPVDVTTLLDTVDRLLADSPA